MPKKNTPAKANSTAVWTIILCLAIGVVAGFLLARARYKPQLQITHDMVLEKVQEVDALKSRMNRLMMVNGRMLRMKDGEVTELNEDATLNNDTKVTTDGKIVQPDGTTTMMKNGDSMGMDGMMFGTQQ